MITQMKMTISGLLLGFSLVSGGCGDKKAGPKAEAPAGEKSSHEPENHDEAETKSKGGGHTDDHEGEKHPEGSQGKHKDEGAAGADHKHEQKKGGDHDEVVVLSPEAVRSAGFEIATVARRPLRRHISASAQVSLPPDRTAKVAPRVPGRVASLSARLGQRVKRSTVLAVIESAELGRARADYLAAATKARVADSNARREKNLLEKGITSEKEAREAESASVTARAEVDAADARLHAFGLSEEDINSLKGGGHYSSRFPVRSPLDGVVIGLEATIGQTVEGTTALFTVGDLAELWVMLDLYESQIAHIQPGQHVHVTVSALPDRHFDGRVDYVGDIVDEKTRTVKVRVVIPNKERLLKPGMFAKAEIGDGPTEHSRADIPADAGGATGPSMLVVPRLAVQQVGNETVVFVPESESRFRAVEVRTGQATAEEIEIVSGVAAGTRLVGKGAFVLKSELMKESMGEGHAH